MREVSYSTGATTDSERVDEHHDLSSTIESGGEQEVVFTEPTGSVTTEVVLREDGHAEGGEHGRVDTDTEVTEGPYRTHVWD